MGPGGGEVDKAVEGRLAMALSCCQGRWPFFNFTKVLEMGRKPGKNLGLMAETGVKPRFSGCFRWRKAIFGMGFKVYARFETSGGGIFQQPGARAALEPRQGASGAQDHEISECRPRLRGLYMYLARCCMAFCMPLQPCMHLRGLKLHLPRPSP